MVRGCLKTKPFIPQVKSHAPSDWPASTRVWVQDKFPMKAGDRRPISKARRGSESEDLDRYVSPLPLVVPLVVFFSLFFLVKL